MIEVVSEAEAEELKERALWSYRANPPTENKRVIPFGEWWDRLTSGAQEYEPPEISDEEIEALFKQGHIGLGPPGMEIRGE